MFWLKDTTRRWLCRRAFLLCCVVPTVVVSGWSAWTRLESTRARYEAELSELLGLRARCSQVTFPRPGVAVFHWLILQRQPSVDPVRIRTLEIDRSQPSVSASVDSAELSTQDLCELWPPLSAGIDRGKCPALALSIESLTISDLPNFGPVALRAQLKPFDDRDELIVQVKTVGASEAKLASLRFVCDLTEAPGATKLDLHAQEFDLPCALIAAFWPPAQRLGSQSSFRGIVRAHYSRYGSQAIIENGRLSHVDLGGLCEGMLPYHLIGTGTFAIKRAELGQGRLRRAAGVVTAGPGEIDGDLLKAAEAELSITPANHISAKPRRIRYSELNFSFEIDPSGVILRGRCVSPESGVLISDAAGKPLAASETPKRSPISALIRTFAAASEEVLPASEQATALARLLPLPSDRTSKLK